MSAGSDLRIKNLGRVHRNLSSPALYEHIVRRGEGQVCRGGPVVALTGQYTGRSPNDKFTVKDAASESKVWWTPSNKPFEPEAFAGLRARVEGYLQGREIFVQDCYAGTDPDYRVPIRVVTENAWHSLFARNMFVREREPSRLEGFAPGFTVIQAPGFKATPEVDRTESEAFVVISFDQKLVLIGGTPYAGEIKKSIFSVMNYLLPQQGVLSMHCSANIGQKDDTAIFFGLSGTGKTTLSADPDRSLIGDDEHGWSDAGVFNFEGGCYAKVIRLSPSAEPEIYACTRMFGTILENVVMDPDTRELDLDDAHYTENTRASYPIESIPGAVPEGRGDQPRNVVMLTCDAYGVLPPVSRLTSEQAMYHFISGYTAKVAGTERGVTEPQATFSACFGAPFMTLHPTVYAELFGRRIEQRQADCWLINTGWTGGPYGTGERMPIKKTRAMVAAALNGELTRADTRRDPVFGLEVPTSCPGVDPEVLDPQSTWADKEAYGRQATELARRFQENFAKFADQASDAVRDAGPQV
jgi:phosphoenolpyruvate carboxykinase (ATP)